MSKLTMAIERDVTYDLRDGIIDHVKFYKVVRDENGTVVYSREITSEEAGK